MQPSPIEIKEAAFRPIWLSINVYSWDFAKWRISKLYLSNQIEWNGSKGISKNNAIK